MTMVSSGLCTYIDSMYRKDLPDQAFALPHVMFEDCGTTETLAT